jgi:DNA-binding Xre family transcriptional regulator
MVSYKKLWHLLLDKDMKKGDLARATGISDRVIAKMGKGETITTGTISRICKALNCDVSDIMEFVPDKGDGK